MPIHPVHPRLLASSIAMALGVPGAALHAATITVDASCALSSAIISANEDQSPFGECGSGSGDDVIVITQNVTLNDDLPPVTSNIDFVGDPLTPPTISGFGSHRLFFIGAPGVAPSVSFTDLRLESGFAQGGNGASGGGAGAGLGGAIFQYDGEVTLDNVDVQGNQAQGGFGSFSLGNTTGGGGGGGMSGRGGDGGFDVEGGGLPGEDAGFGTGGGGGADDGFFSGGDGGGDFGGQGGEGGVDNAGDGLAFGFGGGGGGGSTESGAPAFPGGSGAFGGGGGGGGASFGGGDIAGAGGLGGFGAGGGSSGSGEGGASDGGQGGFGGGGGSGGTSENGPGEGGSGGSFAGAGGFNPPFGPATGGSGAGLGGAIFLRSGSLHLNESRFVENSASGGEGSEGVQPGQGRGGSLFVLDQLTNENGNQQGMPSTLPTVTVGCGNNFRFDSAADDGGTDTDNDSVFGVSLIALSNCLFRDSFDDD